MPQPTIQAEAQPPTQAETQPQTQLVSFDEFLETCPEDGHYELHRGVVVEVRPTGVHEEMGGFIAAELNFQIRDAALTIPFRAAPLFAPSTQNQATCRMFSHSNVQN